MSLMFEGARRLFANEGGGHRWQRIPPNEKRGRVHTSTITVAVLDPEVEARFALNENDVDLQTTRGSGPGGQHRNKTESCVVATHKKIGISVRVDMRSQHESRRIALKILSAKLRDQTLERGRAARDADRRQQVGTGQRGDKIRTLRTQDDRVTDHRTGQRWSLRSWLRGDW